MPITTAMPYVTSPPTDAELSDDAATWIVTAPHSAGYAVRVLTSEDARRYRDGARGVHVWHLWDEATGCPAPRPAPTDTDLCRRCGALDLDHDCPAIAAHVDSIQQGAQVSVDGIARINARRESTRLHDVGEAEIICKHGHQGYCGFCEADKAPKCEHGNPYYCGFCDKVPK